MKRAAFAFAAALVCAHPAWGDANAPSSVVTAPVSSVNGKTGNVVVPTLCRQQSAAIAVPTTNPATVVWTFPTNGLCNFASAPTCWTEITSGASGYEFDIPLMSSSSTASVTFTLTAHPTSLSIGSLTLPIILGLTVAPPSGTTLILTCTAAPA